MNQVSFPDKKYSIIYADPPWYYRNYADNAAGRWAGNKYAVMTEEDICALPVSQLAADDCVLFIWVTAPMLPEALQVISAWGFKYKTNAFTWIKRNRKIWTYFWGMGFWTRANAEFCFLATKGKPKRINADVHSIIDSPVEEHSKKPDVTRDRIIELVGDLPRIELFARQRTEGWSVWGLEVDRESTIQKGFNIKWK
ncbi:adenine methyltransferase [Candidatus Pacearchaeota archaeon]|nr:adenine methyltransferase [Candidatus Pacearchaeota archaeon]